ncbi:hypothetical protein Tco_0684030, partial [Tanacetum coccineum]
DTDIQEKEQKESQKQAIPSTEWKRQSQKGRLLGIIDLMRQKKTTLLNKGDQIVIKEFYKLVENYGRFGQKISKDEDLEDLLKKIKIIEDIS